MNCPYCNRQIYGITGLQEAQKFQKHLGKCRKNRANMITDGKETVMLGKSFTLLEALRIRERSGQ